MEMFVCIIMGLKKIHNDLSKLNYTKHARVNRMEIVVKTINLNWGEVFFFVSDVKEY